MRFSHLGVPPPCLCKEVICFVDDSECHPAQRSAKKGTYPQRSLSKGLGLSYAPGAVLSCRRSVPGRWRHLFLISIYNLILPNRERSLRQLLSGYKWPGLNAVQLLLARKVLDEVLTYGRADLCARPWFYRHNVASGAGSTRSGNCSRPASVARSSRVTSDPSSRTTSPLTAYWSPQRSGGSRISG